MVEKNSSRRVKSPSKHTTFLGHLGLIVGVILASNDICLSSEEMLKYYKGQDKVEKEFRFLRSDTFSVSKV
ncbi:Mobile element protein [Methanosarcina barkeri 227]|uniref:Mobile element protein n=1 Tax=Methanosarcina barkeri 227 TaxID=1434106 RepID=A0A0E3QYM4_METBA|nr:Mobile element protein [Methanosarcina barkeri 227]